MDYKIDTSEMYFDCIDKAACYTGNNSTNKTMQAMERPKVLKALLQWHDNINILFKQLNTYDASSILIAEKNWMERNSFSKYMPSRNAPKKVLVGQVCTVDFGKTYKGEIGYIHPGLCIGKKENKYLVIPMTTGKKWRTSCYHPIQNPGADKKCRQILTSEGFQREAVLLVSDMRFISGGRILDLHEVIGGEVLDEIQRHALGVAFPQLIRDYKSLQTENTKLHNKLKNMELKIKNLKQEIEIQENHIQDIPNEME